MIKKYEGNYNKAEFYSLMGKFFAEQNYQKALPYLSNRENTIWHVCLKDGEVVAFSATEETKSNINFKTDFYEKSIHDLEKILKKRLKEFANMDKPIQTATSSDEIRDMFLRYGFEEYKTTTNYHFLKKEPIINE